MTRRHPAAVCAAAKAGLHDALRFASARDPEGDPRSALACIQGAVGHRMTAPGRERETLAWVLGASAVPAVLRVRGRREAAR